VVSGSEGESLALPNTACDLDLNQPRGPRRAPRSPQARIEKSCGKTHLAISRVFQYISTLNQGIVSTFTRKHSRFRQKVDITKSDTTLVHWDYSHISAQHSDGQPPVSKVVLY
jgi:hypothetical protein